jgi:hypothetical protein
MTDTPKISYRDPAPLRLHHLQKALPEPDKTSPEWHSFVDALSAAGPEGTPALFITREGLIMDGGRRWRAARQLQWDKLPCIERPEHEAGALIVDSLFGQRNMTRGAKVYLAIGLLPEFVKSAEQRRLENLKRGIKNGQKPLIFPNGSNSDSETVKDLCARLGVDWKTYDQARRVRDLLHDPRCKALAALLREGRKPVPVDGALAALQKELRAEFEPQLLNGAKNLWNVASAIGGRLTTVDTARVDPQLEFVFKKDLGRLTSLLGTDAAAARRGLKDYIATIGDQDELKRLLDLSALIDDEAKARTRALARNGGLA